MPNDESNRTAAADEREESVLKRWSRRKHQANRRPPATPDNAEEPASAEAPAEPSDTADAPTADSPAPEPDVPGEADLPDPASLDSDSDFTAYLSRRVSHSVRRAALRRLFSAPEFNVRDGLDDYDEDYTQFQALGNTVTAHMRHQAERLRDREHQRTEAEEGTEAGTSDTAEAPAPDNTSEPRSSEEAAPDQTTATAGEAPTDEPATDPDDDDRA